MTLSNAVWLECHIGEEALTEIEELGIGHIESWSIIPQQWKVPEGFLEE